MTNYQLMFQLLTHANFISCFCPFPILKTTLVNIKIRYFCIFDKFKLKFEIFNTPSKTSNKIVIFSTLNSTLSQKSCASIIFYCMPIIKKNHRKVKVKAFFFSNFKLSFKNIGTNSIAKYSKLIADVMNQQNVI